MAKIDLLRKIIREEVKKAIQEEMKDILLEAVKSASTPKSFGDTSPTLVKPFVEIKSKYKPRFSEILSEQQIFPKPIPSTGNPMLDILNETAQAGEWRNLNGGNYMNKIIEVTEQNVKIGRNDGSLLKISKEKLNFSPRVGDIVEIFENGEEVVVVDSTWNKTIIRVGEFGVSGHLRLQPFGKGRTNRKLIYVSDYMKKGYVRNAKKQVVNG